MNRAYTRNTRHNKTAKHLALVRQLCDDLSSGGQSGCEWGWALTKASWRLSRSVMPLMRGNSDIGTLNRFALYTYKRTSTHTPPGDTRHTEAHLHVQTEAIYLWGEEDVGKSDAVAHTVVATRTRQQLLNASESVCDDLARPVVADLHALIIGNGGLVFLAEVSHHGGHPQVLNRLDVTRDDLSNLPHRGSLVRIVWQQLGRRRPGVFQVLDDGRRLTQHVPINHQRRHHCGRVHSHVGGVFLLARVDVDELHLVRDLFDVEGDSHAVGARRAEIRVKHRLGHLYI
mmetsp:Transcript_1591/g.4334  ORF Transcript_1591/g.4334 Transcript_1591/m.4334 type:complete len:286 (+) Transcript_1591:275-1132(+)